eukprot:scaffold256443_cov33-Tisochrysis_lutea.AAC.2
MSNPATAQVVSHRKCLSGPRAATSHTCYATGGGGRGCSWLSHSPCFTSARLTRLRWVVKTQTHPLAGLTMQTHLLTGPHLLHSPASSQTA